MSDNNSEWQNRGFGDEEDDFDKTVSAFSGQPVPKKTEAPVEEEEFKATFEEDEDDDFDRTVSAFSGAPRPVVQKTVSTTGIQNTVGNKNELIEQKKGFWSTLKGKFVKVAFILLPLVVIGLCTGPGALVIIPFAVWLVFWKLK